MEKLKEVIARTKAGISIEINQHKQNYQSVEQYITERLSWNNETVEEEIGIAVYDKMVETNTIIELQVYPDTPIGFYRIWHYDVEIAIERYLKAINE